MSSEDNVLFLSTNPGDRFYTLNSWNLRQKTNTIANFPLAFEKNYRIDLMLFKQTQAICVCENSKDLFNLSYFKLPLHANI